MRLYGNSLVAGGRSFAGPDRRDLDEHERALLGGFAARWAQLRVLDLGVGTGRTWFAFGRGAGRYTGVEVVAELARRAVERTRGRAAIVIADAARLPFGDGGFDIVCFPFNGLDYAEPPTRSRILGEVARVLAPGGYFYFTTHSLEWLSHRAGASRGELSGIERQRASRLGPQVDATTGIAVLHDDAGHGTCYVSHPWAVLELRSAGFELSAVHGQTCSCRAYLAQLTSAAMRS